MILYLLSMVLLSEVFTIIYSNFTLEQDTKARRGVEKSSNFSLTSALDGLDGQSHARADYLREKPGTHCIGGWVSPRASGRLREISPTPGFDPRTFQSVESSYMD